MNVSVGSAVSLGGQGLLIQQSAHFVSAGTGEHTKRKGAKNEARLYFIFYTICNLN
jgi:hypothetical protein